jgi:hypothetical protein
MHVVSHPEADEELEAAALWYEERQSGLGEDFLNQFERTLRRIVAEPDAGAKFKVIIANSISTVFLTPSFTA